MNVGRIFDTGEGGETVKNISDTHVHIRKTVHIHYSCIYIIAKFNYIFMKIKFCKRLNPVTRIEMKHLLILSI